MKTQKSIIIGHRGAAGLATENTIDAIKAAKKARASMIEIDIRQTADGVIVLCHDETLERTFGIDLAVHEHSLKHLRALCPDMPTLEEAFKIAAETPLIIEIKAAVNLDSLFAVLDKYKASQPRIASFHHNILRDIKHKRPKTFVYVLEHHSPFEIINRARALKADGVGYNFSLVNPFTYWLTKRHNLKVYAYTVNHPINGWFITRFYPRVAICSDFPNRFTK